MNNNFNNKFSLHLMTAKEPEINIIAIVIAVLNIPVAIWWRLVRDYNDI